MGNLLLQLASFRCKLIGWKVLGWQCHLSEGLCMPEMQCAKRGNPLIFGPRGFLPKSVNIQFPFSLQSLPSAPKQQPTLASMTPLCFTVSAGFVITTVQSKPFKRGFKKVGKLSLWDSNALQLHSGLVLIVVVTKIASLNWSNQMNQ